MVGRHKIDTSIPEGEGRRKGRRERGRGAEEAGGRKERERGRTKERS